MTAAFDVDPLLRRLERTALVFSALAAVVALGARRGDPDVAIGIVGGGCLIGLSYWAIRSGVDGLLCLLAERAGQVRDAAAVDERPGPRRPGAVGVFVRVAGRYGLLAILAYVMIVRLRLHPIGLLIGVSSVVVAASVEAVRMLSGPGRAGAS